MTTPTINGPTGPAGNLLLVVPPQLEVHDVVVTDLVTAFGMKGLPTKIITTEEEPGPELYGIVVLFEEAYDWFRRHKDLLKGGPRVVCASYRHADVLDLLQDGLKDLGVHAFLTSSQALLQMLQQKKVKEPRRFSNRPIRGSSDGERQPLGSRLCKFGTVIEQVDDQDLSLVQYVLDQGYKVSILLMSGTKEQLPASLQSWATTNIQGANYKDIENFILAPRVTDYQGSVVPLELFKAVSHGCRPLLVSHPALQPLHRYLNLVPSMTALKARLHALVDFPHPDLPPPVLPPHWLPSGADFVKQVFEVLNARA